MCIAFGASLFLRGMSVNYMDMNEIDLELMRRASSLAENGVGFVNPNPLVGAVIVKDGRVIGEGWHERYGQLHAERNALKNCKEDPAGTTMYVTLEPCCHYGKTPPCTDAIIASHIKRVVVGIPDPNPLVAGKGISILKNAGIEVECGLMEDELREQNRVFLKYISRKNPWVALKWAMTLDGKIATCTGDSRWVSSGQSRQLVHKLRHRFMSVLCGVGTVLRDDPMLNCRIEGFDASQPVRIVLDNSLRIPLECQLVRTARQYRTVVACVQDSDRRLALEDRGVEVIVCEGEGGKVSLKDMLRKIGAMGIDSVLVEGGGEVIASCFREGVADEVYSFVAPKVTGGSTAPTPVGGEGVEKMGNAVALKIKEVQRIGEDVLIRSSCLQG